MSLVGPRPLPIYEVSKFEKSEHRRRLSVKPGITCVWQVKGRNTITEWEDWVKLDLEYIDNWSCMAGYQIADPNGARCIADERRKIACDYSPSVKSHV